MHTRNIVAQIWRRSHGNTSSVTGMLGAPAAHTLAGRAFLMTNVPFLFAGSRLASAASVSTISPRLRRHLRTSLASMCPESSRSKSWKARRTSELLRQQRAIELELAMREEEAALTIQCGFRQFVARDVLGMLREAKERSDANRASPLELKLL